MNITDSNEAKDYIQHLRQFLSHQVQVITFSATTGNTYVSPAPATLTTRVENATTNLVRGTTGVTGTTTYNTTTPATATFTTGGARTGYGVTTTGTGYGVTTGTPGYGITTTTGATNYGVTTGATNYAVTTGTVGRTSGATNVKFGYSGAPVATTTNSYNIVSRPVESYTTTYNTGAAYVAPPVTTYRTSEGKYNIIQLWYHKLYRKYIGSKQYPNPSLSPKSNVWRLCQSHNPNTCKTK